MRPVVRRDLLVLLSLGLVLRWVHVGLPDRWMNNELFYIQGANEYLLGQIDSNSIHPPLGKLMMGFFAEIWWGLQRCCGQEPGAILAWRAGSVVMGLGIIGLTYALAMHMFDEPKVARLAGFFVAIDLVHIAESQCATVDMYAAFWIVTGLYCTWRYIQGQSIWMIAAGGAFGCGVACKWNTLFAMVGALIAVFTLSPHRVRSTLVALGVWTGLTIAVYAVSFGPLLVAESRGRVPERAFSDDNLLRTADHIRYTHERMVSFRYNPAALRGRYLSQWYEWPTCVRPVWYWYQEFASDGTVWVEGRIVLGSIWTWGAFLCCLPLAFLSKNRGLVFCAIAYAPQVMLWSVNAGYMYYMLPCIPLMSVILAHYVAATGRRGTLAFVAVSAVVVLVFYPLVVGLPVPKDYFQTLMISKSWI